MEISSVITKTTADTNQTLASLSRMYRDELVNHILPFWLRHSKDEVNGGYFTCLDRYGKVYDTDKFMWLQGRGAWCFSFMYHHVEQKQEWLEMALHGARFMEKFGRDQEGNWYFSLTTENVFIL